MLKMHTRYGKCVQVGRSAVPSELRETLATPRIKIPQDPWETVARIITSVTRLISLLSKNALSVPDTQSY